MTIQTAIEKAISEGWKSDVFPDGCAVGISNSGDMVMLDDGKDGGEWVEIPLAEVFLDAMFWQFFGKAFGLGYVGDTVPFSYGNLLQRVRSMMLDFMGNIADGGTPEEYFEKL